MRFDLTRGAVRRGLGCMVSPPVPVPADCSATLVVDVSGAALQVTVATRDRGCWSRGVPSTHGVGHHVSCLPPEPVARTVRVELSPVFRDPVAFTGCCSVLGAGCYLSTRRWSTRA